MCDVFQLLKYFDNFYNFTSHFIKSFPENINIANTISNCLIPEECTLFQTIWNIVNSMNCSDKTVITG